VRVVDEDEERRLLGGRGEQAQRGGADGEALARGRARERKRAGERGRLRLRDPLQAAEERPEELREGGEREPGLGLDPETSSTVMPSARPRA